jgi:hypothetical protein
VQCKNAVIYNEDVLGWGCAMRRGDDPQWGCAMRGGSFGSHYLLRVGVGGR